MTAPAPVLASCTRAHHDALKADDALWFALHYVGPQRMHGDGDDLELRDCPWCSSTLSRPITTRRAR